MIRSWDEGFVTEFSSMQEHVHEMARDKGWWPEELDAVAVAESMLDILPASDSITMTRASLCMMLEQAAQLSRGAAPQNDGEKLMLVVSELGEALEALRHGNPASDHIPEFNGAEEELADVIIRIMDLAQKKGWRVAEAIVAKAEFNATRPFKHGKKF